MTEAILNSSDQYSDGFAARWDELVDWPSRAAFERGFIRALLDLPPGARVLDIACGTGFHSALIAELGYRTTAIDASAEMVTVARRNLAGIATATVHDVMRWEDLGAWSTEPYAAVVCLGSSIPHANEQARRETFAHVRSLLEPGGRFLVDHRNFDYIVANKALPGSGTVYRGNVRVSLESATSKATAFGYTYADGFRRSLTVESLRFEQVRQDLRDAGFAAVKSYGDQQEVSVPGDAGFLTHCAAAAAEVPDV